MTNPYLPFLGADGQVKTDTKEIVAYVLQRTIANPGNTSPMNEAEQVSLRKIIVECNYDLYMAAERYAQALNLIFSRYFSDGHIKATTDVVIPPVATDPKRFTITVMDTIMQRVVLTPTDIQYNSDTNELITNFK